MGAVKDWAISVCMAVVAGGLAYMISPGKSLEKVYRLVLSVFFITAIISPIVGFSLDESIKVSEFSQNQTAGESDEIKQQSDAHLEDIIEQTTIANLYNILSANEIFPKDIQLSINTDDISDILISDAVIIMDKEGVSKQELIKNIVRENLFVTPEIIWE